MNGDVRSPVHVEAALGLAALGFTVFPIYPLVAKPDGSITCGCGGKPNCPGPGKHPNVYWRTPPWPTRDPELIVEWWTRHRACGIGIAPDAQTVLLDLDQKHEAIITQAFTDRGIKIELDTAASVTASRGWHLYYKLPASVTVLNGTAVGGILGVDVRTIGGFAVAPPSGGKNGLAYQWIEGRAPGERERSLLLLAGCCSCSPPAASIGGRNRMATVRRPTRRPPTSRRFPMAGATQRSTALPRICSSAEMIHAAFANSFTS